MNLCLELVLFLLNQEKDCHCVYESAFIKFLQKLFRVLPFKLGPRGNFQLKGRQAELSGLNLLKVVKVHRA